MLEVRKLFELEDSIQAASGPASTIISPLYGDYFVGFYKESGCLALGFVI